MRSPSFLLPHLPSAGVEIADVCIPGLRSISRSSADAVSMAPQIASPIGYFNRQPITLSRPGCRATGRGAWSADRE